MKFGSIVPVVSEVRYLKTLAHVRIYVLFHTKTQHTQISLYDLVKGLVKRPAILPAILAGNQNLATSTALSKLVCG